ncbi:tyrosyl-DNA phosphodiesterase-domain-containing protein [Xylariaceae sp. FL0594]|nr:tyrosyl-DNA phosphodiesterase-domain-containing protein [Xylariaceae sp. FL0594]
MEPRSSNDPFDGDEDAALRYAIELSLREAGGTPKRQQKPDDPIEISSDGDDDDDDDLDKSSRCPPTPKKSAMSPKNAGSNPVAVAKGGVKETKLPAAVGSSNHAVQLSGLSALGLDRKKMEEERLARVAKRKAPDESTTSENEPPARRVKLATEGLDVSTASSVPYPRGAVKKTWAYGYPRQGDDIKIEEIFQKDQLELAVLSSFQWDDEWLMSKLDIKRTRLVCIAFAASEAHKKEMRDNVPRDRIRFCFPPMMPAGNMHSKLQLLKFPKYLRIVIPTGNLVPYDWGETGVMENMVFLIDLPLLEPSREHQEMSLFGRELSYFLKASELDSSLVDSLSKYDFSETNRYRFVHTIGQTHTGADWKRTGYCGLGTAVASLGLATTSKVELDYVVASLGAVNSDLLSTVYNAARGDDGWKEYEGRTAAASRKKDARKPGPSYRPENFRVYFPSNDTVEKSRGGVNAGGTICVKRKWWEASSFPRELIHDCKSVRSGLLMHSKMLFVRHQATRGSETQKAWAYVGSANLSESAWGRLVRDRATGLPKLTCRNWECGVVIPVESTSTESAAEEKPLSEVFGKTVPVPMVVPGEAYGKSGTKEPWYFREG